MGLWDDLQSAVENAWNDVSSWLGARPGQPPMPPPVAPPPQAPPAAYLPIAPRPPTASPPSAPAYAPPALPVVPHDSQPIYRAPMPPPPPAPTPIQPPTPQAPQPPAAYVPIAPSGAQPYSAPFTPPPQPPPPAAPTPQIQQQTPHQLQLREAPAFMQVAPRGVQPYSTQFALKPPTRSDWWSDPATSQPRVTQMGVVPPRSPLPQSQPPEQSDLWGLARGPDPYPWMSPPDTWLGRTERDIALTFLKAKDAAKEGNYLDMAKHAAEGTIGQTGGYAVGESVANAVKNPSAGSIISAAIGLWQARQGGLPMAVIPKALFEPLNFVNQRVEQFVGGFVNLAPEYKGLFGAVPKVSSFYGIANTLSDPASETGGAQERARQVARDYKAGKLTLGEAIYSTGPSLQERSKLIQSQLGADYSRAYRETYGIDRTINENTPENYALHQVSQIAFTDPERREQAVWRMLAGEDPQVVLHGIVQPADGAFRDEQELYQKRVREYVDGAERIVISKARTLGWTPEQISAAGQEARAEARHIIASYSMIPGEENPLGELLGNTVLATALNATIGGPKAGIRAANTAKAARGAGAVPTFLENWNAGNIALDPTNLIPLHKVFGVEKLLPRNVALNRAEMLDEVYRPEMEQRIKADLRGLTPAEALRADQAGGILRNENATLGEKALAHINQAFLGLKERTDISRANQQANHAVEFMSRLIGEAKSPDTVTQRVTALVMGPEQLAQDVPELGNLPFSVRAQIAKPVITSDYVLQQLPKLPSMNEPVFNRLKFLTEFDELSQRASSVINRVRPPAERSFVEKLGSATRAVMGEAFLREPGYVIRNAVSDFVVMAADGVVPSDSIKEVRAFLNRVGMSAPEIGGEIDATGLPAGRPSMLNKVPITGKVLAWVPDWIGDWNARLDVGRRARATYAAMRQFLDENWQPEISPEIRGLLGPQVADSLVAALRGTVSNKELREAFKRYYDPKTPADTFSAAHWMKQSGVPLDSISPVDMVNLEAGLRDLANANATPEQRTAFFKQWRDKAEKHYRENMAKMGDVVSPKQDTMQTARADVDEAQHNVTQLTRDMARAGEITPKQAARNIDEAMRPVVEGERVIDDGRANLAKALGGLADKEGITPENVDRVAAIFNWAMNKEYELRGNYRQEQARLYRETQKKLSDRRRGPTAAEAWSGQVWREYFDANKRNAQGMHDSVANAYHWASGAVDAHLGGAAWDTLAKEQPDLMSIEGYAQKLIDETRAQADNAADIEGFNRMLATDRQKGDVARKELFRRAVVTLREEPRISVQVFDVLATAERDVRRNAAKAAHDAEILRDQMVTGGKMKMADYYKAIGEVWRGHFNFAENRNNTAMVQLAYTQARNSETGRMLAGLGYSDKGIAEMIARMDTADGKAAVEKEMARAQKVAEAERVRQQEAAQGAVQKAQATQPESLQPAKPSTPNDAPPMPARDRVESYLREQFKNLPEDQLGAAMAVMDARAELWARKTGATPDGWYSSRLATEGASGGDVLDQDAYHGGPHRFDRFSTDKIGSGEGSQSYGWGLYFAGKKEVAEHYREMLSTTKYIVGENMPYDANNPDHFAAATLLEYDNNTDSAIKNLTAQIEQDRQINASWAKLSVERKLDVLERIKKGGLPKITENTDGQLYRVEIPDDSAYLLWDKPLSEQPEKVRNTLLSLIEEIGSQRYRNEEFLAAPAKNGGNEYKATGGKIYQTLASGGQKEFSQKLASLGIAGIKYLDGSSRSKGEGSYNYVIFDDKNVNIKETYYQTAYHGSPHRFDQFTLNKVGAGEGQQAQGWGLYFADRRSVAEWYRNELSRGYYPDGKKPTDPIQLRAATFVGDAIYRGIKDDSARYRHAINKIAQSATEGWTSRDDAQAMSRAITRWEQQRVKWRGDGQVYRVEIPDDGGYLLWDKPFAEQPRAVKQALKQVLTSAMIEEGKIDPDGMRAGDGVIRDNRKRQARPQSDAPWVLVTQDRAHDLTQADVARAAARNNPALFDRSATGEAIYKHFADKLKSQRSASLLMHSAGIDGVKYLDGTSRAKGSGTHNYVIFNDRAVQIKETFYQGEARGSVSFLDDGRAVIKGLQSPDISTLMHEIGHVFRRDLEGDDMRIASEWAGAKQADDGAWAWDREAEEKFARGFEKYLQDGEAPLPGLRRVFDQFKSWLTAIYRRLRGVLPDTLSDEMRGVFDRLLAERVDQLKPPPTTEAFAEVRAVTELTPDNLRTLLDEARRQQARVHSEADFGRSDQLKAAARQLPDAATVHRWLQPSGEPRRSITVNGRRYEFPNGWVDVQGGGLDRIIDEAMQRYALDENRTGGAAQAWFDKLTEARNVHREMRALADGDKRAMKRAAKTAEDAVMGWQRIIDDLETRTGQTGGSSGQQLSDVEQAARAAVSEAGGDIDAAIERLSQTVDEDKFISALDALERMAKGDEATRPQPESEPPAPPSPQDARIDSLTSAVEKLVSAMQAKQSPEPAPKQSKPTRQLSPREQIRAIVSSAARGEITQDEARARLEKVEPLLRDMTDTEQRMGAGIGEAITGQARYVPPSARADGKSIDTKPILERMGAEQVEPNTWRMRRGGAESPGPAAGSAVDPETLARYQDKVVEGGAYDQPQFTDIHDAVRGAHLKALDAIERGFEDQLKNWKPEGRVYSGKERGMMQKEIMRLLASQSETVSRAREYGKQMQRSALLDYADRRGFDTWLGLVAPFSYWGTRQGRNYALRIMSNPAMLTSYLRFKQQVEKENRRNNVRGRFGSGINVLGSGIYIDPTPLAFPFADIIHGDVMNDAGKAKSAWQQIYDLAGMMGMRPSPIIDLPLRYSNLLVTRAPGEEGRGAEEAEYGRGSVGEILPITGLIQAATAAFGVGGPTGFDAEGRLRKLLGMNEGETFEAYRIARSISDMAALANQSGGAMDVRAYLIAQRFVAAHDKDLPTALRETKAEALAEEFKIDPKMAGEALEIARKAALSATLQRGKQQFMSSVLGLRGQVLPEGEKARWQMRAYEQGASYNPYTGAGSKAGRKAVDEHFPALFVQKAQYGALPGEEKDNNYLYVAEERKRLNAQFDKDMGRVITERPWDRDAAKEIDAMRFYTLGQLDQMQGVDASGKELRPISIYGANKAEALEIRKTDILRTMKKAAPKIENYTSFDAYELDRKAYRDNIGAMAWGKPEVQELLAMADREGNGDALRKWLGGLTYKAIEEHRAQYDISLEAMQQAYFDKVYEPTMLEYNRLLVRGVAPTEAWAQTIGQVGGLNANDLAQLVRSAYGKRFTDEELATDLAGARMPPLAEMIKNKYEVAADGGFKYRQDYLYGAKNTDPTLEFWRWYRNEIPPGKLSKDLKAIPQIASALDPIARSQMTPEQWQSALQIGRAWMASHYPDVTPEQRTEWAQARDEQKQFGALLTREFGPEGQRLLDAYSSAPTAAVKRALRDQLPALNAILTMRDMFARQKLVYDAYYGPGSYGGGAYGSRGGGGGPRFSWSFARGYSGYIARPRYRSRTRDIAPPKIAPRKVKMMK